MVSLGCLTPLYGNCLSVEAEALEELSKRTRTRYMLTLLILITIPCYLLGFILLRLDRGPLEPTPTITLTGTITSTATITLTPYLTRTATITPTASATPTITQTPTQTATVSPTPEPSETPLPTHTDIPPETATTTPPDENVQPTP